MKGKRILLIEDNITLAAGLQACLISQDFQVRYVSDGQEALAVCQERLPDLIVTDVLMQTMDGLTFIRRLRDLPGGGHVPVIVISGIAQQGYFDDMKKLGIRHFLIKPFALRDFLDTIRETFTGTVDG